MPRLPSGKMIGLSKACAAARFLRLAALVGRKAAGGDAGSLMDVLYYRNADQGSWYYSGMTLAELLKDARQWLASDREAFEAWLQRDECKGWLALVRQSVQHTRPACVFQETGLKGVYYSSLRRRIESLALNRAPARQWRNTILNLVQDGVSAQEVHWSGVLQWLSGADGRVARAEVLAHLDPAPVAVTAGHEVVVSGPAGLTFEPCARLISKGRFPWQSSYPGYAVERYRDKVWNYRVVLVRSRDLFAASTHWVTLDPHGRRVPDAEGRVAFDSPNYAQDVASRDARRRYPRPRRIRLRDRHRVETLPEGECYREWLITLPDYPLPFLSPHFHTLNVLVHVRTTVRTEHQGERRILFLEEVQSDWFQGDPLRYRAGPSPVPGYTPDVPYRSEWVELALKLMCFEAARQGLDGVGWTRGSQQEIRYGRRMPAVRRIYDWRIPRFFQRLARALPGTIGTVRFRTRGPGLYLRSREGAWGVFSDDGRIATRYRFSLDEARATQIRHSKVTVIDAPIYCVDPATREAILEQGFPLFGWAGVGFGLPAAKEDTVRESGSFAKYPQNKARTGKWTAQNASIG